MSCDNFIGGLARLSRQYESALGSTGEKNRVLFACDQISTEVDRCVDRQAQIYSRLRLSASARNIHSTCTGCRRWSRSMMPKKPAPKWSSSRRILYSVDSCTRACKLLTRNTSNVTLNSEA